MSNKIYGYVSIESLPPSKESFDDDKDIDLYQLYINRHIKTAEKPENKHIVISISEQDILAEGEKLKESKDESKKEAEVKDKVIEEVPEQ